MSFPVDADERKQYPVVRGVLDYFPDAIMAVARVSEVGNNQHNPGEPLHWARAKSTDQADCLVRHLMQRGTLDSDGLRHTAKVAWRALALLQLEIEAEGGKGGEAQDYAMGYRDELGASSGPDTSPLYSVEVARAKEGLCVVDRESVQLAETSNERQEYP